MMCGGLNNEKNIYKMKWLITLLLFVSCIGEETVSPKYLGENLFDFHIALPDMRVIHTRADLTDDIIDNIYLLVFDQNGSFLSRTEAIQNGANAGDYLVRLAPTDPDLLPEQKKRVIHFVANQDWSAFSDVKSLGRSESDVIMDLFTTSGKTVYWHRMELSDGINTNIFDSAIEMISNRARVSVIDNSGVHPESGKIALADLSFALGDYLDCGTIAPFNLSDFLFDETSVTESQYAIRQQIKESDFVTAGDNNIPGKTIECYEHVNSASTTPMYIILKARYNEESDFSYYKIDIVPRGQPTLLDIQRNCHYIIDIQSANAPGSKSLSDAMSKPATNNLMYSVMMEKYTSISYGSAALYVETVNKTLVHAEQTFRIGYNYFPDINGPEDNSTIQVRFVNEDPSNPVIDNCTYTKTSGDAYIEVTTAGVIPPYGYSTAKLEVGSDESGVLLRRIINLRLRQPSSFENFYIYPTAMPAINQRVEVHFTIPSSVQDVNFPMPIYITTTILIPNLSEGHNSELTLDYSKPGRYRYKYIAGKQGGHTVYFKTMMEQPPQEKLILESELFTTIEIPFGP